MVFFENSANSRSWEGLLHEIETRGNLQALVLGWFDSPRPAQEERTVQEPAALLFRFVRAALKNQSIGSLTLESLRLSSEVIALLDTATALRGIHLNDCVMTDAGAQELAKVLQRSTTLETLKLIVQCRNANYVLPALRSLRSNVSISDLSLGFWERGSVPQLTGETSHALRRLFESTTTIETVGLSGLPSSFGRAELLPPIFEGLIRSECVTDIELDFYFQAANFLVSRMLREKQNLRSLTLVDCWFARHPRVCEALEAALLRPQSSLRTLNILEYNLARDLPSLQAFLHAIVNSKLDRFALGLIDSQAHFHRIINAIPNLQVKKLTLIFGFMAVEKEALLCALKRNYHVQTVTARHQYTKLSTGNDLFDEDADKKQLTFVTQRNTRVVDFADNPETVNRAVWPDTLSLAEKAGHNSLFCSLRSVLGNGDFGLSHGKRKRKRPRYYQP